MDISKRYSIELNKISNHLADLERGHIYELTKTPGTPSCATLAQHLKEDIGSLLDLIQNDKPGVAEKVAEAKTYSHSERGNTMFDINYIEYNPTTKQYTCCCQCASPQDAQNLVASNLNISRMLSMSGEMFHHGSAAYIGAGIREDVIRIAKRINSQLNQ